MAGSGNLWAGPVVINITNKLFMVCLIAKKNVNYLYVGLKENKLRVFYAIFGGIAGFRVNRGVRCRNRES